MTLSAITLPLFVPADAPRRFAKAAASGADAVLIDLEDAVAPEAKDAAREGLADAIAVLKSDVPLLLRVNAVGTPWHDDDLRVAAALPLAAIMLPKAESGADLVRVSTKTGHPVIALVETARGLHAAHEIAMHCERIAFGSIDYAADLVMDHTRQSLLFARSQLVLASRLAGRPAPFDGVTTAITDAALIESDSRHVAELGFAGKLLIHPAQVEPARCGLRPGEDEIAWAERVLAAAKAGEAAQRVDGAMVDAPVVARARHLLMRAGRKTEA